MNKDNKPVNPPGVFKRPVKKNVFEKKYLKYIEHPQDKTFFASCFEEQGGCYVIRNSISRNDVKKLKSLINVVKANRKGAVMLAPVFVLGVVIAAVVVFFVIFANPLLERALEKGLEAVFEARSDINGFRLSLIRFSVSMNSITVANRDKPMTNLFQMGRTVISLRPQAVLRGKIYIEEIRADTIRFGTERTVSGALPNRPPKEKPARQRSETPPLIDLRNFDAMAMLNQEYDKLNSPKLYDDAINAYNEASAQWKSRVDDTKTKVEELRAASTPVLNMNVSSMRDAQAINDAVQSINTMISTAQSTADEAAGIVSSIEGDINAARSLEQNARNALTDDINRLKSYIDLGSGSAFAVLEPVIRDLLSDTAEEYVDYGVRALEVLEKVKTMADALPKNEKPKKEPKVVFKGRDVIFPVAAYPQFYLGILASDFTLDTWNWAFDLRDISSNPDMTNKPVTLKLAATEAGGVLSRQAGFNGSADFRTNPGERFSASLNASGFPFSFTNQMNSVGINGFSGESAFNLSMSGQTSGAFSLGSDVRITAAKLGNPVGTLAQAVDTAVREANNIDLGIQYLHHIGSTDEFNITTNIAELIAQAVRRTAEVYAKQAMDEIEALLRQRITQYIDGKFLSKEELDLLFASARGDRDSANQLGNALTNKKNEFEQRLRSAADSAIQQGRDEATQQLDQMLHNALPGGIRLPR